MMASQRTDARPASAGKLPPAIGVLAWIVVVVVGALVLGLVIGLGLFKRLGAGQHVVDNLSPAFTTQRVAGTKTGVDIISTSVDTLDPVVTPTGGGAAEVPKLITFLAKTTKLSEPATLTLLNNAFPATTNLLQALPLSSVSTELPQLETFLATTLKVTPAQLASTLTTNFPHLAQAIAALPTVTNGWENVPNLNGLTRFDGSSVQTVPQLRDYFKSDVVPILPKQQTNFSRLRWFPPVGVFPILLTVIGIVVVLFGVLLLLLTLRGAVGPLVGYAAWTVVLVVGAGVLVLVFAFQLFVRLDGGQDVVKSARPAFTQTRVAADTPGIDMVSTIVDAADPILTRDGGAAAEVPKLITFVSQKTGLSEDAVKSTLLTKFPATTHLLLALPLSNVSNEIPGVLSFLEGALTADQTQVLAALKSNFPALTQAIVNLPTVTSQWNSVTGTTGFTRFDGSPVSTVPQVRDYLKTDLVPAVAKTAPDFRKLDRSSPSLKFFPPLLTAIGVVVVVFALLMLFLTRLFARRGKGYEVP